MPLRVRAATAASATHPGKPPRLPQAGRPSLSQATVDLAATKDSILFTSILQPSHLIIILVIALLILGPKRLPDAGRALGQGLKEFRSSVSGAHDEASAQEVSASVSADHEDDPSVATRRANG
jgi:sec-independent protein translocase protein TatA